MHSLLRFALCLALAAVLVVPTASAQEAASPLEIESPGEGERVETPFTVSGRAPAGVQLELWLGSALERVFRSDSTGRFSTPVSSPIPDDTKIWVHEIGTRGNRVRSTFVIVNWSGEAAPRPPEPGASRLEPAGEVPDPIEESTEPEPARIAPGGTRSVRGGGLPPVEELESVEAAPVPPPVDDAAGVDPFETADQVDPFDSTPSSASASEAWKAPTRPPPARFVRGLAETGVGLATAAAGAFVGGLLGAGLGFGLSPNDGFAAAILAAIGVIGGWTIGLPVGVMITGKAMQGNGKLWATILGEVVGFVAAGVASEAYYSGNAGSGLPGVLFVTLLPAAGAAMGYELTSDHSRFEPKTGLRSARPTLRTAADGTGAVLGVQLQF